MLYKRVFLSTRDTEDDGRNRIAAKLKRRSALGEYAIVENLSG